MQFLGWFEDPDSIYLAMEYIEHGDLSQHIKGCPAQAKGDVEEIATQILEGLAVLHGRGICHRDMKPQVRNSPSDPALNKSNSSVLVEYSHRIPVTDMGQNLRLWDLETHFWNILKNRLRFSVLSSS